MEDQEPPIIRHPLREYISEESPIIRHPLREYTSDEQSRLLLMMKDCLDNALRPILDPHHYLMLCAELVQHLNLLFRSDLCQEWSLPSKIFRVNFVKLGIKLMIRQQFRANLERGVHHGTNGAIFDYKSLPAGWKCHLDIFIDAFGFGFAPGYEIWNQFGMAVWDNAKADVVVRSRHHTAFWELPLDLAEKLIPGFLRNQDWADIAWSRFPHLRSDREFWEGLIAELIADPAKWQYLGRAIEFSDDNIRSDRDLMLQACIHDTSTVHSGIDPALIHDNAFFEAVVNQRPQAAHWFPIEVQRANRDWILAVLPSFEDLLFAAVPPEFFDNEAYLLHWIRSGGIFFSLPAHLRRNLVGDQDTFQLFASNHFDSFEHASQNLRSNKVFMLEMIEIQPRIYAYVAESLENDMDIRVAAARDVDPSNERDMLRFGDVSAHVQAGLTNRAAFETFCFGTHPHSGSPASSINLDLMNCIAEFVWVPEDDELRRMRNCFQGRLSHAD